MTFPELLLLFGFLVLFYRLMRPVQRFLESLIIRTLGKRQWIDAEVIKRKNREKE